MLFLGGLCLSCSSAWWYTEREVACMEQVGMLLAVACFSLQFVFTEQYQKKMLIITVFQQKYYQVQVFLFNVFLILQIFLLNIFLSFPLILHNLDKELQA